MDIAYIKLSIAVILTVIIAVLLYLLNKKTAFKNMNNATKQIIYGVVFGGLAVLSTEWGIPLHNAQINCRDASVLIAGLMFGSPAGIIAGIIGGVERWVSVAWGVSSYTRVACSVSTLLAGFYSALLRRYMFENKKPGWLIAFAIGVVMEVFHLTMVFFTNLDTPVKAMSVVASCSLPMIIGNGAAVMLSGMIITLLSHNKKDKNTKKQARITQTIQRWLLITVFFAFVATTLFVFQIQTGIAINQENQLLSNALDETKLDIIDASNDNLIKIAKKISKRAYDRDLNQIATDNDVSEINVVDSNGIIINSTNPEFIGFDMASGEQSEKFLCLLNGHTQYIQEYGPISYGDGISRKYAAVSTSTGFVQVGYTLDELQKDIESNIVGITENYHVGRNGYVIIVDINKNVLSAPKGADLNAIKSDLQKMKISSNEIFRGTINSEKCCMKYRMEEGYYIISVMPESDVLDTRNIAVCVNAYMQILVFAVMFGLIFMLIKRIVVNKIKSINNSLAKITGGDLSEIVNVRSNEEFASLSDDINLTVDTLKKYIDEASKRIDAELEFAKNIQKSALPSVFPAYPKRKDFDIYAYMNPAKEVGGDFYDFYMTDSDTMNITVADVSGKGIPAAMFMMRAKTELKSLTEAQMELSDVFTHSNDALCEGNDAGMFVTAWQGQINLKDGVMQFANAGHNPPIIIHDDGTVETLKTKPGFVLAGMDGIPYKTRDFTLAPGDTVFLYTDGVTEATTANNELYGEERLLCILSSKKFDNPIQLCKAVKNDVDSFVGDAPQFDDITMLAFKYIGTPPSPSIYIEKAHLEDITAVTEFIESELEKIDCPSKAIIQINVAIDEIFSNIIRYGYKDCEGPVEVKLIVGDDPKRIYIRFEDEGVPYNPLTRDDPDVTLSAEDRSIGGLGIFMVKKTMDDIKYKYESGKNILTIQKIIEK